MPIDPNIALGVRPLEVPDTLNQLAKVTQIQSAQQQRRQRRRRKRTFPRRSFAEEKDEEQFKEEKISN